MSPAACTACSKVCPACQKKFECDVAGECWCGKVTVSLEMLVKLRRRHDDCLCNDCLALAAAGKVPGSADENEDD